MVIDRSKLESLIAQVGKIYEDAKAMEAVYATDLAAVHPRFQLSARNLLHYIALRHHDIRPLQMELAQLGLSSLGRIESRVLPSLYLVHSMLCRLVGSETDLPVPDLEFAQGQQFLEANAAALLGVAPQKRTVEIMVTMPDEAATDPAFVETLLTEGMNCARINCAHDDPEIWGKMVEHIHQAKQKLGLDCRILMDLAGPKLRTGPLKPGPRFVRLRPKRDKLGRVIQPCRVWLGPADQPVPAGAGAFIPVDPAWLTLLQPDDEVNFIDTRGNKCMLSVRPQDPAQPHGWWADIYRTAYLQTGDPLRIAGHKDPSAETRVGELPPLEIPITLHTGDTLLIHKADEPGEPAQYDEQGHLVRPAHTSCTLPEIFSQLKIGESIKLDDGNIEGVIVGVSPEEIKVNITYAKPNGSRLRADKGINLPKSRLGISGLTPKDRLDLDFVAHQADIVSMSFVNKTADVLNLLAELNERQATDKGIVLKIETRHAFNNLPMLLLTAMRHYPAGVMIARGDLAVECGWKRLAVVQEQILWLCEAAHIPVIWATQVLENLAKTGLPSRAEITDAAMAQRAECVMLNKGPGIRQAIYLLDEIMKRMQEYQNKKTTMLRQLKASKTIMFEEIPE
ncbi:MAG TPA: pyruvate kinase [Anaerolineae bacterium]|nr:pyruvate kinase [Anaerolineae bacterium]